MKVAKNIQILALLQNTAGSKPAKKQTFFSFGNFMEHILKAKSTGKSKLGSGFIRFGNAQNQTVPITKNGKQSVKTNIKPTQIKINSMKEFAHILGGSSKSNTSKQTGISTSESASGKVTQDIKLADSTTGTNIEIIKNTLIQGLFLSQQEQTTPKQWKNLNRAIPGLKFSVKKKSGGNTLNVSVSEGVDVKTIQNLINKLETKAGQRHVSIPKIHISASESSGTKRTNKAPFNAEAKTPATGEVTNKKNKSASVSQLNSGKASSINTAKNEKLKTISISRDTQKTDKKDPVKILQKANHSNKVKEENSLPDTKWREPKIDKAENKSLRSDRINVDETKNITKMVTPKTEESIAAPKTTKRIHQDTESKSSKVDNTNRYTGTRTIKENTHTINDKPKTDTKISESSSKTVRVESNPEGKENKVLPQGLKSNTSPQKVKTHPQQNESQVVNHAKNTSVETAEKSLDLKVKPLEIKQSNTQNVDMADKKTSNENDFAHREIQSGKLKTETSPQSKTEPNREQIVSTQQVRRNIEKGKIKVSKHNQTVQLKSDLQDSKPLITNKSTHPLEQDPVKYKKADNSGVNQKAEGDNIKAESMDSETVKNDSRQNISSTLNQPAHQAGSIKSPVLNPKFQPLATRLQEMIDKFNSVRKSTKSNTTFRIESSPAGKMEIQFEEKSGHKQIKILVENESTQHELQKAVPQLQQNLNARGIELASLTVQVSQFGNKAGQTAPHNKQGTRHKNKETKEVQHEADKSTVTKRNYGYNTIEVIA